VPLILADLQYIESKSALLQALRPEAVQDSPQQEHSPNPFQPLTGGIEDSSRFFGRRRELEEVFDLLEAGASVAVIGERGVGKSSLLLEIHRQAQRRWPARQVVYLNLQSVRDEDDFYDALCSEVGIATCQGYRLRRSLQERSLLLILDEIEKMAWDGFTPQLRDQLRELAEGGRPLRLVVSARDPLDRLFSDSNEPGMTSPLAGVCLQVELKCWDEAAIRRFVLERLADTTVAFNDEEVEQLSAESRGHPQRLMQCCFSLYGQHIGKRS